MVNAKKLIGSFKFAFSGIKIIFKEEHSLRIMFFIALVVIMAMFYFNLPITHKAILFLIIMFVLTLELLNSAVEKFLDFIHPDGNHRIKIIKDVLAGIVLIASLGAAVIGILIFWPHFS